MAPPKRIVSRVPQVDRLPTKRHSVHPVSGSLKVVSEVSGRRRWSEAEKLEILAEAFRPGVRVCDVTADREVLSSLRT